MGIAVRMAALMHLHREETYQVQNPTADLNMRAESARRTLVSRGRAAPPLQLSLTLQLLLVDVAQPRQSPFGSNVSRVSGGSRHYRSPALQ